MEALAREEQRRVSWRWENALRRHNFIGFVGELMKGVVRAKVREGNGAYEQWVEAAKKKTEQRVEERRKKGIVDESDM